MSSTIITVIASLISALITGLLAFAGVVYTSKKQYNNSIMELKEHQNLFAQEMKGEIALIQNDIKILNSNVEKHNKVVERTYNLETAVSVIDTRLKNTENQLQEIHQELLKGD